MSTRKKSRKLADRICPTEKDPGYAIYRSLARMVNQAPKPQPLWLDNESDEEQRRAAAPGLAWGWLQRTLSNGEAAIKLEKSGYGSESAPLLRSALGHAMRLVWADSGEGKFVEVAMLAKKNTSKKMLEAQHDGWRFDMHMADQLQQYADATTDEFKSMETFTHLKNAIDKSPEEIKDRLKSMYLAWLAYTAASHPSIDSAEPYIDKKPGSHYMALLSVALSVTVEN
ncbi:hypothetical protein QFZ23_002169 [Arthrobacter globiformis]|uniref:hypothetical protein n=1 Tax=Arthrobacter globiformis TaxID=1665 RepID=UPI002784B1E5|nr:hypothetical protein [Arthrobacter globiformis]MDQ1058268.1 hypothetical protein [Arthrobacter globiformis]